MVGMAAEAGAMEDGAVGATTGTATMAARVIEVVPWLAARPTADVVHLVAGTAGASRAVALHGVGFTPAAASMAAEVSTAADTGRLRP